MGLYQGVEKSVGQGLASDAADGKDAILCMSSPACQDVDSDWQLARWQAQQTTGRNGCPQ